MCIIAAKPAGVAMPDNDTLRTMWNVNSDGAGFMSVCVLVAAMIFMSLLTFLCKKFKLKWLETFALPISMFAAMGVAILISKVCPEGLADLGLRG